jgi:hypothetical protein
MKTIPSIEESICTSALKNYADVDDRYYEHFYWCPALKRQADGDNLLNHIKSKQLSTAYNISLILAKFCRFEQSIKNSVAGIFANNIFLMGMNPYTQNG